LAVIIQKAFNTGGKYIEVMCLIPPEYMRRYENGEVPLSKEFSQK